jgi:3-oxoacyl-[acyl-carrier protein] reductase
MGRLQGKVAIITGAAGGIGAATVARFVAEGAAVAGWDLRPVAGGPAACSIAVDVTDEEAVAAAVEETVSRLGGIDVLVNNAGITRDGFAEKLAVADWEAVLAVNLTGTYLPCRAVIPRLRERGGGRIINTASTSAFGNRGQASYSASKAGVIGLTRTLALELAADGITANCVAPGPVATAMLAAVPEKVLAKFRARIPLGRFGRPEEIAGLHAFLASDDAAYITGQTLICDGGLTLA